MDGRFVAQNGSETEVASCPASGMIDKGWDRRRLHER